MATDEATKYQLQETLHVELIPGTEVMTDVGDIHFKQAGHHVLVPQPSNDPHDPLNWSRKWKSLTVLGMCFSSFSNGFSPTAEAPQVPYYMAEWHRSLPDIINFIGVCILVLGFSNFIWVPFARAFGRRPMLLVSTLLGIGAAIWRARARSYDSFLGASIVSGIACGPGETFGPMLVTDVFFLHERGLYMGLYSWSYWGGVMIGPVVAGVVAERYGWRNFWWTNVAVTTFALIYQLLFLPETKYHRSPAVLVAGSQTSAGHTLTGSGITQKTGVAPSDDDLVPGSTEKFAAAADESGSTPASTDPNGEIVVKLTGYPSRKQFLPFSGFDDHERIFDAIWIPFKLFSFPIIQWSSFVFSMAAANLLTATATQSQAFAGPPWNFSAYYVGLTNLAVFAGGSVALAIAGPVSDWVSMRATVRNRGIREPEMRLPTLIPFVLAALIGGLLLSLGYQYAWPWEPIVIIGYTLLGFQTIALSAIAITYSVDSYPHITGEFLISATINKNLWGYGVSKFLNVWIDQIGYIGPIMTITALNLFFSTSAIIFYIWGKRFRKWTRHDSVHRQ